MGRKSKLKRDKRRATAATMRNNNNQEAPATESVAGAEEITTINANANADDSAHADAASLSATDAGVAIEATRLATILVANDNHEFPESDFFLQAVQLLIDGDLNKALDRCMYGATEHGCINSMYMLGEIHTNPKSNDKFIYLALPWFLEGAIRGGLIGTRKNELMRDIYCQAEPFLPKAILKYWMIMFDRYEEWAGRSDHKSESKVASKKLIDLVEKKCIICEKRNSTTLTLRQCMGCSTCCYCSEGCQTIHWVVGNHRSECKHIQILNKYHKPYAKEIREAAIRGETHPVLEKLRNKLGLTRPTEEYQELCDTVTNNYEEICETATRSGFKNATLEALRIKLGLSPPTEDYQKGKPISPCHFLVARNDGKVWIGSTPNSLGPPSSTNTTTTTTTKGGNYKA